MRARIFLSQQEYSRFKLAVGKCCHAFDRMRGFSRIVLFKVLNQLFIVSVVIQRLYLLAKGCNAKAFSNTLPFIAVLEFCL